MGKRLLFFLIFMMICRCSGRQYRAAGDEWLPPGWLPVVDLQGSGRTYYWDMTTNRW
jgi:hypothetical protein